MAANVSQSSESIRVKVVGMDEDDVYFRVKMNEPLDKIMAKYREKMSGISRYIQFVYDGKQINAFDTPEHLGMDDGDTIQAFC